MTKTCPIQKGRPCDQTCPLSAYISPVIPDMGRECAIRALPEALAGLGAINDGLDGIAQALHEVAEALTPKAQTKDEA